MRLYTYNSVMPYEVGQPFLHSVFGKCIVHSVKEGGLFGYVLKLRKA